MSLLGWITRLGRAIVSSGLAPPAEGDVEPEDPFELACPVIELSAPTHATVSLAAPEHAPVELEAPVHTVVRVVPEC